MTKTKKRYYIIFPAICLLTGALSGFLIRKSVKETFPRLSKPPFMPPAAVFPVVWTILYVLMGIGMAQAASGGKPGVKKAGAIWAIQLALNFSWSLIFFNGNAYLEALACLIILWGMVLWMTVEFMRQKPLAGWLQAPYLIWVAFAGYLNAGVWILNR